MEYNVYCDESCHLEHDESNVMVIGGIWCPRSESRRVTDEMRTLRAKHKVFGELKWIKVSKSKELFYQDLIAYFFQERALTFRCIVVQNKDTLDHRAYNLGSHDTFFYKMYYFMLRNKIRHGNEYNIYLDVKDTRSARKVAILKDVVCSSLLDFERRMVKKMQSIRSYESQLLQLTDLLIGALSYTYRGLTTNPTKLEIIKRLTYHTRHDLHHSTPPWEEKFNVFVFTPTQMKSPVEETGQ